MTFEWDFSSSFNLIRISVAKSSFKRAFTEIEILPASGTLTFENGQNAFEYFVSKTSSIV